MKVTFDEDIQEADKCTKDTREDDLDNDTSDIQFNNNNIIKQDSRYCEWSKADIVNESAFR